MLTKQLRPLGILLCVQCAGSARPGAVLRAWGLADPGWGQRDSPRLWDTPWTPWPSSLLQCKHCWPWGGGYWVQLTSETGSFLLPFSISGSRLCIIISSYTQACSNTLFVAAASPSAAPPHPVHKAPRAWQKENHPTAVISPGRQKDAAGLTAALLIKTPGAERGGARRYLGLCAGRAGGAGRCLGPLPAAGASRQPQQPLSRTCRCSSSSEWVKAGLSRELADASQERDQYWAETSSSRQKRR